MSESLPQTAKEQLLNIKKLGNTIAAINQLQELLSDFPKFIPGWINLGLIYRSLGDRDSALSTFEQTIKLAPNDQKVKLELSVEQLCCGQLTKCRKNIEELLAINPKNIWALIRLGQLNRHENKRTAALISFQKALKLSPKTVWASIYVATELRCLGRFEEAAQTLTKALEYSPNNFNLLLQLGHLERQRQQRDQALKWFSLASEKASSLPDAINAELYAIEELRGLGNLEQAATTIKQILKKFPDNIRAKLIYGTLLKLKLKFDAAVEVYQEIITLKPENIQAHLELATCLSELGKTKEALDILENATSSYPDELKVLLKIGDLYRKKQDRRQALKYYQKFLAIAPQNIQANLNVATELQYFGNLEAAETQLHQALEYHPNNFYALMKMAQLEQTRQNLDVALESCQKVIDHYPNSIEPHLKIIGILGDLGSFEEANNNLKILHQKYPEEFRILIHYGHLERRLGQREKALQWFNLAQEKTSNLAQNLEFKILAIEELIALGRLDEAIKLIDPIIQQFPHNLRAQMIKGRILQKQPNLTAAANVYRAILSTEANHLNSRIELARTYSQLGQIEIAISLLEETYELLGANIQIFMLLGSLNQALEEWEIAALWYQKICQEYPYNPQGYCHLADLMFVQGETESALKLLEEAKVKLPSSLPIIIKLIEFQIRLDNLDLTYKIIREELKRFPDNVQLLWKLCRVQMQQGDYTAALSTLDKISTDNQDWIRQTQNIRANIYFNLYDYPQAEKHFKQAISLAPVAPGERNRLATILMLTGRIDEARQELKIATKEIILKTPPGKSFVPLRSHPAMVTNELRMNPPLMAKLQAAQQEIGAERISALGSLLAQEPNYLGTALYLARELREQGIFEEIRQTLSQNATNLTAIPRRIVQFWDEPQPPIDVQRICQSWSDLNPGYEYIRFSLNTAVDFLKEHYDQQVLKAFANCDEPATQADFFRLAYLNKMGGFYADADDLCRQSLDTIVNLNPELVVLQEDFASIGNNFLGCIPGQSMIRTAFYQAVHNLSYYCNESPWFKTGPGLITSAVCSGLLPYLTYTNYQIWPRLLVLTQAQLRKIINQHISLAYKTTAKSWQNNAYKRRIKVISA
ncbi:MAG: tetratricopeptide repeat protein [Xenococcus sp. MO_188.B8]|nr:tetratricopeptide repeat protein [Xenococcus sp. MO_188.B8]